jgi:hypothetical protein
MSSSKSFTTKRCRLQVQLECNNINHMYVDRCNNFWFYSIYSACTPMQQFVGRQVAQLRTHFPDYEPTSLCSYLLMQHAKQRSSKYQFYSLWFDLKLFFTDFETMSSSKSFTTKRCRLQVQLECNNINHMYVDRCTKLPIFYIMG